MTLGCNIEGVVADDQQGVIFNSTFHQVWELLRGLRSVVAERGILTWVIHIYFIYKYMQLSGEGTGRVVA